jgi:hypothetical protein
MKATILALTLALGTTWAAAAAADVLSHERSY